MAVEEQETRLHMTMVSEDMDRGSHLFCSLSELANHIESSQFAKHHQDNAVHTVHDSTPQSQSEHGNLNASSSSSSLGPLANSNNNNISASRKRTYYHTLPISEVVESVQRPSNEEITATIQTGEEEPTTKRKRSKPLAYKLNISLKNHQNQLAKQLAFTTHVQSQVDAIQLMKVAETETIQVADEGTQAIENDNSSSQIDELVKQIKKSNQRTLVLIASFTSLVSLKENPEHHHYFREFSRRYVRV
eukprot:scaffold5597_cov159-Ochromonas_danica.AAC.6